VNDTHYPSPNSPGAAEPHPAAIEFTGRAGEYFRIWIVNMALTVVTLGIYAAWAKVRTRRYFYRNTVLLGDAFDFHADPWRILRGHIIAVSILAPYAALSYFRPELALLYLLLIMLLMPFLWVQSRAFNLGNTSYRGVRFGFRRDYKGAYAAIFMGFLVTLLTLGLASGYAEYRRARFAVTHSRFGTLDFAYHADRSPFIALYIKAMLVTLGAVFVVGLVMTIIFYMMTTIAGVSANEYYSSFVFILYPVVFLAYVLPFAYLNAGRQNLLLGNATLGPHALRSNVAVYDLFIIYLSNLVMIALSLGLLMPWAKVRLMRYRLSCVQVVVHGDIVSQSRGDDGSSGAAADTLGEALSLDFGL